MQVSGFDAGRFVAGLDWRAGVGMQVSGLGAESARRVGLVGSRTTVANR